MVIISRIPHEIKTRVYADKLIEIQIVQSLSFVGNIIVQKLLLFVGIKDMTEQLIINGQIS